MSLSRVCSHTPFVKHNSLSGMVIDHLPVSVHPLLGMFDKYLQFCHSKLLAYVWLINALSACLTPVLTSSWGLRASLYLHCYLILSRWLSRWTAMQSHQHFILVLLIIKINMYQANYLCERQNLGNLKDAYDTNIHI